MKIGLEQIKIFVYTVLSFNLLSYILKPYVADIFLGGNRILVFP